MKLQLFENALWGVGDVNINLTLHYGNALFVKLWHSKPLSTDHHKKCDNRIHGHGNSGNGIMEQNLKKILKTW